MATTVDRAMAKAAAALLPGLLPTPPTSAMIAPCIIIPRASFASSEPKPGRADAVERWDAHKNDKKKPGSPVSSSGSCSSGSPSGRASACDRWDINKKKMPSEISTSSSSSSSSRGSSTSPGRADAAERWDSNKRPPSRSSSADRWDAHKKPRPAVADAESQTGEQEEQEVTDKTQENETTAMVAAAMERTTGRVFSGPSFFASQEPAMLPMTNFFASPDPVMLPVPALLLLAH